MTSIYRALAGGVTSANLLHGSANAIGGQNRVIKLRWGADAEGLELAGAPPGIKFALGENPKRSNYNPAGIPARYPRTRMGVMDVIRDAFTRAREYDQSWDEHRAGAQRNQAELPRRDLERGTGGNHEGKRRSIPLLPRGRNPALLRTAEVRFRVATPALLEGYRSPTRSQPARARRRSRTGGATRWRRSRPFRTAPRS
jgi:hypothetical protein